MSQNATKLYSMLLAVFVVIFIISNIAATKLITVGGLLLDGGAILFPVMYILNDVIAEVYGYRQIRRTIWTGFAMMVLTVAVLSIVRILPYPESYTSQVAFDEVFGFLPRIVLASLLAYIVGSFVNAYVLVKIKAAMKGRRLWVRLIGSTVVGELVDTIVFCLVAFGGIISANEMTVYILVGWTFKTLVEVIMLPITYRTIAYVKKYEQLDVYDRNTDMSPFTLK